MLTQEYLPHSKFSDMLMDALEDDTEKLDEANNFDKALGDIISIITNFASETPAEKKWLNFKNDFF